jgi:membrane fusion protein (multidrug efflux system)
MKKILIFLLLVGIVVGGWFLLKRLRRAEEVEPKTAQVALVETAPLEQKSIHQTVDAFGVVASAPSGERVLTAHYECVVKKILVGVGTPVEANDVLLEVEPSPEARLAFESARSALALANQALIAAQERYDLRIANNQDLLTAKQAADDARLKAASLEARGLNEDGKITAKEAGVVSKLDAAVGAWVPSGTALVTVSTGGERECRLAVEAADLADIAAGQKVMITSSNRSALEKIPASVRLVGAELDPTNGAAEIRVPVPNGAALYLGEHVRAAIEVKSKDGALVVPRSAVLPMDDKQVLFTVVAGKAVRHEVIVGLETDDELEVSGEGLHPNDVVVTRGNYELENGMAVQSAGKEQPTEAPSSTEKEKRP